MATDVLIVSRTRMSDGPCVGGIEWDTTRSVRLIRKGSRDWGWNAPFQPGQVWSLTYTPHEDPTLPHVEDVMVTGVEHRRDLAPNELQGELLERRDDFIADGRWWEGEPQALFQGSIRFTGNHSGYIQHPPPDLPSVSTGFWVPDVDLHREDEGTRVRFTYQQGSNAAKFTFKGDIEPPDHIEAGTLCRVSLARWWDNNGEFPERCYVQLSGVYL